MEKKERSITISCRLYGRFIYGDVRIDEEPSFSCTMVASSLARGDRHTSDDLSRKQLIGEKSHG